MGEYNDTLEKIQKQAEELIGEHLGDIKQKLNSLAHEHEAITRERELKSPKILLQLLFIYAMSSTSLKLISVVAVSLGECCISDEAWRQRFNKCSMWLSSILCCLLVEVTSHQVYFCCQGQEMQVFLVDGSIFKQVGQKGTEVRVHMCYNVTKGIMEEVVVTDIHTAESTKQFKIIPMSLYIADAGYGKGKNYEHIVSNNGNALFRFTPNLVKLSGNKDGAGKIDMAKRLKTKKNLVQFDCFIHTEKGRYAPVRIIASKLPEDKALLAKERKIRTSQKKQAKIKPETLIYCQWVILMTNLDYSHSAESLLHIYRSRWQIELLFKRIKQFFNIRRLRKASFELSKVLVFTWLVIWAMVERDVIKCETKLIEQGADMELYSVWAMADLIYRSFETVINAVWVFNINVFTDVNTIYQLLRNHKSSRCNQYYIFRLKSQVENDKLETGFCASNIGCNSALSSAA